MFNKAPTVVSVFVVVVLLDPFPLAVRSVRLLMLLLFILTAFVNDIPVLSKIMMLWLYPLTNLTEWLLKEVAPKLAHTALAMDIHLSVNCYRLRGNTVRNYSTGKYSITNCIKLAFTRQCRTNSCPHADGAC